MVHADASAEIAALSREAEPREACGLIVQVERQQVVRGAENVSPTPDLSFVIPAETWREAEALGEVVAIWHSHPIGPPRLSPMDRAAMGKLGKPWVLYDGSSGEVYTYHPGPPGDQPLIGRPWRWGTLDCFSLARDYYRLTFGIDFPDFTRPAKWPPAEPDFLLNSAMVLGFYEVAPTALAVHDVLLIRVMAEQPNHIGIYTGENTFLHHATGRASASDQYAARWRRQTAHVMRWGGFGDDE